MTTAARLLTLVLREVWRNRIDLLLASFGVALAAAALTVLLSLAAGVRAVVVGRIFPLDRLEVRPRTVQLDVWAFRLGLGSDALDEQAIERIRGLAGVRAVFPKMALAVPAVLSGGAGLLGSDIVTEVIADGIDHTGHVAVQHAGRWRQERHLAAGQLEIQWIDAGGSDANAHLAGAGSG